MTVGGTQNDPVFLLRMNDSGVDDVCGTQIDPPFLLQRTDSGVDDCWNDPLIPVTED